MEVMDQIYENNWKFDDKDGANLIKQILRALNYMHKQNVVHRDLKLENVMIDIEVSENGTPEMICKLADFGFSCVLEQDKGASLKLGTHIYMAPELFKRGGTYDSKVDTWALGVLTYIMLCANFPFIGNSKDKIAKAIKTREPDYSKLDKYQKADLIKDFLFHCLDKNPETRYSAEQLLQHEWI